MIISKYDGSKVQILLLQMDDSLENRLFLDKQNPDLCSMIMKNSKEIDVLLKNKEIDLNQTYCFFMGAERLSPIMINHFIRKFNDYGVTHCSYIRSDYLSSLTNVSKKHECVCDSYDLLWRGHKDGCKLKK